MAAPLFSVRFRSQWSLAPSVTLVAKAVRLMRSIGSHSKSGRETEGMKEMRGLSHITLKEQHFILLLNPHKETPCSKNYVGWLSIMCNNRCNLNNVLYEGQSVSNASYLFLLYFSRKLKYNYIA